MENGKFRNPVRLEISDVSQKAKKLVMAKSSCHYLVQIDSLPQKVNGTRWHETPKHCLQASVLNH
ncbi:hypothetical protein CWO84_20115 [Methylomonas sp. Kb3]|nr:hypothetical protein CWO84_20115 [Methylomonas sp. Kb3]